MNPLLASKTVLVFNTPPSSYEAFVRMTCETCSDEIANVDWRTIVELSGVVHWLVLKCSFE